MFRNALISTSDKSGLLEFVKPLNQRGMRVVSTGGTSKFLRENGVKVVEVAEQTGFPEVMDGRVRTLHPLIHMPLLARQSVAEDIELLKKNNLEPFDLVIVNLYPFADALKKGVEGDELIEFIDIGGPSLLRAAAKNMDRIAVVCDPQDYTWIAEKISKGESLTLDDRKRLAGKVFSHTSKYDALIAKTLSPEPEAQSLTGEKVLELRYGENPQQKAWWFKNPGCNSGLHEAEILHGKALSYNNLLDLEAAVRSLRDFSHPAAVAVKHNNPCGIGIGKTVNEAVERTLKADPVSVFGGIISINREVDLASAEKLLKIFLECVIAPSFSADALSHLQKKKDLRLLAWPKMMDRTTEPEFRTVSGGYLLQTQDKVSDWSSAWQVVGTQPTDAIKTDLQMAWTACAHLKSNAIALASNGTTVGLGMGQVNRVDAVQQAILRMKQHHPDVSNVVLASDAFFPFPDSIELIAQAGIKWVIQPGGSIRDEAVIAKAKELGVNMVLTQVRHFRH
jgi:phosphoribosylaminoimidazolecarboxamide formyltransferase / IMP cyclohydrolase